MSSERDGVRRSSRQRIPSKKLADMEVQMFARRNRPSNECELDGGRFALMGTQNTEQLSTRTVLRRNNSTSQINKTTSPVEIISGDIKGNETLAATSSSPECFTVDELMKDVNDCTDQADPKSLPAVLDAKTTPALAAKFPSMTLTGRDSHCASDIMPVEGIRAQPTARVTVKEEEELTDHVIYTGDSFASDGVINPADGVITVSVRSEDSDLDNKVVWSQKSVSPIKVALDQQIRLDNSEKHLDESSVLATKDQSGVGSLPYSVGHSTGAVEDGASPPQPPLSEAAAPCSQPATIHVIQPEDQDTHTAVSMEYCTQSFTSAPVKSSLESESPGRLCYVLNDSHSSLESISGNVDCSLVMTIQTETLNADPKLRDPAASVASSSSFFKVLDGNEDEIQMTTLHVAEDQVHPADQVSSHSILDHIQRNPGSLMLETIISESSTPCEGQLPIKFVKLDKSASTDLPTGNSTAIVESSVDHNQVSGADVPQESGATLDALVGALQNPLVTMEGHYQCIFCPYNTDKRANWYEHKKCHSMRKFYPCKHCDYTAAKSSNLRRHMLTHVGLKQFFCTTCNTSFRQKSHLQRHIKYKHEEKQVKCEYCDYVCASYNPDLKTHMLRKHLLQANEEEARAKLSCSDCGFVAASIRDLGQHMKFHRAGPELKLYCELCSFVTDCMSRLKRHILVHSKERPFGCELCNYRATQREHVMRHMRIKHGFKVEAYKQRQKARTRSHPEDGLIEDGESIPGLPSDMESPPKKKYAPADYTQCEKKFQCSQCTMTFSKLLNLYKHLQAQHNIETPGMVDGLHSCLVCDYRTNKKTNLLVHMRKHNPSHPTNKENLLYTCMMCKCFTTAKRANLCAHMAAKHNMPIMNPEGQSESLAKGKDMEGKGEEPMVSLLSTRDTLQSDSQQQTVMVELEPGMPPSAVVIDPPPKTSVPAETAEAVEGLTALSHQPQSVTAVNQHGHAMELAAGDLIEIDGEVYKVEFTSSVS